MPTITESKISSGEIGIVWVSYNVKTMVDQFMGVFIQNSSDQKAKDLLIFFSAGTQETNKRKQPDIRKRKSG